MTVSVSLPLFLALAVLAAVGLGYVCCVIADSLSDPDSSDPFAVSGSLPTLLMSDADYRVFYTGSTACTDPDRPFADDWWSEDDVTATVREIREL